MVEPEQIEAAAVPFIIGMAVGVALGRAVLQNVFVGALIGIVLTGVLWWLRNRLVSSV